MIHSIGFGGAENQAVQILNGLNSRIFEKHLIVIKHEKVPNYENLKKGIKYIVIPRTRFGHVQFILKLAKYFKDNKIDIVQSHLFQSNLLATLAARIANKVMVVTTEHGKNLWKKKIHHFIENCIISPLAKKRIAVSEDIRNIRIITGDIPSNKSIVIPPCVEIPLYKANIYNDKKIKIIAVGRLVEAKNYKMLIKAFKLIIDDGIDASLTIVGDGPERINLQKWVNKYDLNNHIILPGYKSNIIKLLSNYDIFAMSSIREGLPVAMLEAMAVGLPVVATNIGGIPNVIGKNENGIIVNSEDSINMYKAIKKLCLNFKLRLQLSKSARAYVDSTYSNKIICNKYEKLYILLYRTKKKRNMQNGDARKS